MTRTLSSLRFRLGVEVAGLKARALGVTLDCPHDFDNDRRASPHATLRFTVGTHAAMLCYGRPMVAGREIFGGLVPFGELWRTGADEPTTLFLPFPATIADVHVPRGRYALYTIPRRGSEATLVVNRSIHQSGRTRAERGREGRLFGTGYTDAVRRLEAGRSGIESREVEHVERLSVRAEAVGDRETRLLVEWERLQLIVPIRL